jgi:methylenetetrahydrofolate--tRNA-(uracil-5-)-methyltransferase
MKGDTSGTITIIGGGLSGCEAALQSAQHGIAVRLFEMRPGKVTGAHRTGELGELVCSNSLRSMDPLTAPGQLKRELSLADSLVMEAAVKSIVPAGSALAVDRGIFAEHITARISDHPRIELSREEVKDIPDGPCIIATGPLTSEIFSETLRRLLGERHLYFYDAIAPIIDAESIDYSKVFRASRYDKGGGDYLNCPMTEGEYSSFYKALSEADRLTPRPFEDEKVFEGCMPVEVMALRGKDTLRFGPLKPVGLKDPRTDLKPYAVVQLRVENRDCSAYNIVGFQTRLKWTEQGRVFRLIPGLEKAEFLRYGSIHRNSFINGPMFLNSDLSLKINNNVHIAGQLSGVEGYIESTAMGLLAGINAARKLLELPFVAPPRTTAHGSLLHYITESSPNNFQPSNINFGLFPQLSHGVKDKKTRRKEMVDRALSDWKDFIEGISGERVYR